MRRELPAARHREHSVLLIPACVLRRLLPPSRPAGVRPASEAAAAELIRVCDVPGRRRTLTRRTYDVSQVQAGPPATATADGTLVHRPGWHHLHICHLLHIGERHGLSALVKAANTAH